MRGIFSYAGYVPVRRLDRSEITGFVGSGGGKGRQSVASFDEDTTTMGVEAARLAFRPLPPADDILDRVWNLGRYPDEMVSLVSLLGTEFG